MSRYPSTPTIVEEANPAEGVRPKRIGRFFTKLSATAVGVLCRSLSGPWTLAQADAVTRPGRMPEGTPATNANSAVTRCSGRWRAEHASR